MEVAQAYHKRSFFDQNPDPMLILSMDGMILDQNRAFQKMLGRSQAELVACFLYDLISHEDRELLFLCLSDVACNYGMVREVQVRFSHNALKRYSLRLFSDSGTVYGSLRQQHAGERNSIRSELSRLIQDCMLNVLFLDMDLSIIAVSKGLFADLEHEVFPISGRKVTDIFNDHVGIFTKAKNCAVPCDHRDDHIGYSRADGTEIVYDLVMRPWFMKHNEPGGYICHLQRCDRNKSAEHGGSDLSCKNPDHDNEMMASQTADGLMVNNAQAENLKRVHIAQSRFMANMSHELRTPLNAIIGFAQLLSKQTLSGAAKEYVDYIESSGKVVLGLLADILDLSRIEEGKVYIEQVPFLLKESIEFALKPYRYKCKEKGVDFVLEVDDALPGVVSGDASKIVQVLINLVSNAMKFTSSGMIKVRVTLDREKSVQGSVGVRFAVSDTGIGVPQELHREIFEAFRQVDTSLSKQSGGVGLGLTIASGVVRCMGGELAVVSPVNQDAEKGGPGSCFYFDLEMCVPEIVEHGPVDNGSAGELLSGNYHVLVVEDDLMNQKLAELMLKANGCTCEIAGNGKVAVGMDLSGFDLILMDVQMPQMDGIEATRIIRSKGYRSPIIALTAHTYQEDLDAIKAAGMDGHISKPIDGEQLNQLLRDWLVSR